MRELTKQQLSAKQFERLSAAINQAVQSANSTDNVVRLLNYSGHITAVRGECAEYPFKSLIDQDFDADEAHGYMYYNRLTNELGVVETPYDRPYVEETYWSPKDAYGYYDHVPGKSAAYGVQLSSSLPEGWYDALMTKLTGRQHPTLVESLLRKVGM